MKDPSNDLKSSNEDAHPNSSHSDVPMSQCIMRFLGIVALLCVIWLVLLPMYARRPTTEQHLQWLEATGIDPSAMYYTELEAMEAILKRQRLEQLKSNS